MTDTLPHPPMRPWDHSDPSKPDVWVPGGGPCICAWCVEKRQKVAATIAKGDLDNLPVMCTECGAKLGHACVTPENFVASTPHQARIIAEQWCVKGGCGEKSYHPVHTYVGLPGYHKFEALQPATEGLVFYDPALPVIEDGLAAYRREVDRLSSELATLKTAVQAAVFEGRNQVDNDLATFGYNSMEFACSRGAWLATVKLLRPFVTFHRDDARLSDVT